MYLKTLELKPPQQVALRIFKYWPVMNFLDKLGLAKSIAKGNAKGYSAASAMGIIIVRDKDEDFIKAGRLVERIWLKAVKMGLSFHLITGIFFFWQRIMAGEIKEFSEEHVNLIKDAYQKVASTVGVSDGEIVALLFRIGEGGKPSAYSKKLPLESVINNLGI